MVLAIDPRPFTRSPAPPAPGVPTPAKGVPTPAKGTPPPPAFADTLVRTEQSVLVNRAASKDAVMLPARPVPGPGVMGPEKAWTPAQAAAFAAEQLLLARRSGTYERASVIVEKALERLAISTDGNFVAHIGLHAANNMTTAAGKFEAGAAALTHLGLGHGASGAAAYRLGLSMIDRFQTPEGRGRAALGVLSGIASATHDDGTRIAAQTGHTASNHQTTWEGVERGVVATLKYMDRAGL